MAHTPPKATPFPLRLTVRGGCDTGKTRTIDRDVVTIGKRSDCDLVLVDDTVSRLHARILRNTEPDAETDDREAGDWRLEDLGSTNGTFLNGVRVKRARLSAGDVFLVGTVPIAFAPRREEPEPEPEPWPEPRFGPLLGRSVAMRRMFGLLARIAPTSATVLLEGETGTGKGLVARAIHEASRRSDGPYVVVDCGAVQRTLVESELFGHQRGAFSHAFSHRPGAFERAHRGTAFIDELSELDLDLQPKLLRVVDAREVRRVGATKTRPVDLRIIAASGRDLSREVERGAFREDLFFRLSVVRVRLPPLRTRAEDIPMLAEHFVSQTAKLRQIEAPSLTDRVIDRLTSHDWPGNVRELKNCIERAVFLSAMRPGQRLELAASVGSGGRPARIDSDPFDPTLSFSDQKERWIRSREKAYVKWLLEGHGGNVSRAARAARMDRKYLYKLIKKHREGS